MNNSHDYFLALCNLWCEQHLTSDELLELQSLLRSDRTLQMMFVEFTQLHGQLAWDAGVLAGSDLAEIPTEISGVNAKSSELSPAVATRVSRFRVQVVAATAACLLIAGLAAVDWQHAGQFRAEPTDCPR